MSMRASRTAVLVCQGRAVAHDRIAPGRFADPTAMTLLRPEEQDQVRRVRDGERPASTGDRMAYEMVRVGAELIVPRTVAIDDAVLARPAPQVVVLGAGLDGRAWRMPALATATVFEVDQPASQQEKRDRAAGLPAGRAPHFVPVDFGRDALGDALAAAGHRAEVTTSVAAVAARSGPGSRLIVNYQAPSLLGRVVRRVIGGVLRSGGHQNPWAAEPWRSAWSAATMSRLLAAHGFAVRDDHDLLTAATALGTATEQRMSLTNGRVAVADRE
jgi:O-methyltransferase involved in polyketide biosynthesis